MQQQLKVFKIIHLALVAGLILAYIIIGNLLDTGNLQLPTINSDSLIYLLIPIAAYIISNLLFKMLISKIDAKLSFEEKLPAYQSASIVRWAIIEGAAFIILILKPELLIFGGLLIVYLILLMPTESRIKSDLNILG